jgi:hypothetical protein
MAKPANPVAPTVSLPAVTPPRQTHSAPAAIRRSQASRVRTQVRTQLAQCHRRRRELSYASSLLRRQLKEFRSHVRMRIREMSRAIMALRIPSPDAVLAAPARPVAVPPESSRPAQAPPVPAMPAAPPPALTAQELR